LLDAAVRRLRGFVGWTHPDVEALSLRCGDPALRTAEPVTAAPMFRAGWDLLVEASWENPDLIPAALWDRVRATAAIGPFLVWAADGPARAAHAGQLARWFETAGTAGADAARRLGLPAVALAHADR
jgi:hypothetical protein